MCANPERVALAEQVCERVVCELAPGDALFFHCNLLHCSAPNVLQDEPRWVRACVLLAWYRWRVLLKGCLGYIHCHQ